MLNEMNVSTCCCFTDNVGNALERLKPEVKMIKLHCSTVLLLI